MATRDVFSDDELAQLRGLPEPARSELIRYFTLAPADEAFVRKFRGRDNVLGAAVQLCTLPWLGFVPDVLAAVRFAGGPGMDGLLQAVAVLAGLYAAKARKVPDGAPDGFVPARWAGYLEKAAKDGDVTAYRHYWELCMLMALRGGLCSGDIYVPESRRYADPAAFLLAQQQWEPQRLEFCHLVGKPASPADALALADDELHAALSDLEAQLARGGGPGKVRLGADGELVIPPLTAEDVPAEAEALRAGLGAMLPRVPIASVLVEVDARTGFSAFPGSRAAPGWSPAHPAEPVRR